MTIVRRRSLRFPLALATVLAAGSIALAGQQPKADPAEARTAGLAQTIPVDPRITTGQLPNGLRYYVRANARPDDRAELRLVVKAGSVLESDAQRGLAHFVEHMAFNGTRDFPKQSIVNFIESIGMRFGSDLNAYTSYDETVYMLEVPTDNAAVMDKAMSILENWAHEVTFDPVEIDKERGVIIEERRLGLGAQGRLRDKQFPVLFQNSRYADRSPIGTLDVLQHFTPDELTSFYHDWYRPDLMAVVAVGDFDVPAVEAMIRQHFTPIPAAVSPRLRPVFTVPEHPGTTYAIATDAEASSSAVIVYHVMPARDQTTIAAYRQQQILDRLFTGMLNARFAEIAQKPNPPFQIAQAGIGQMVRTAEASTLAAAVPDGGIERGLEAVFVEAERVAKFGFTQTEFDRQKTRMLRSIQAAMAEFDNQESSSLAAEYIRNFLTDEPIPGLAYENVLYQRFIADIKLEEVNALARNWAPDRNRVVVVTAPAKAAVPVPTEAQLAAVMASAAARPLTAYVDSTSAEPLMTAKPKPGAITAEAPLAGGVTRWTLSNGATVVLKPTTFKQDEIIMSAFSPGGTSLASDADFVAAETAAQGVSWGGLGKLNATALSNHMAGKVASAFPSIGTNYEELQGGASPQDVEALFQQIYMRFTAPRADPTVFKIGTDQARLQLANAEVQPEVVYSRTLAATLWQNNPRALPLTAADVDHMDLQKSLAFYKDRFADASDFTFVFVGNIDPAVFRPYVEQYIASLPTTGRHESWRDTGLRRATGVLERRVTKGIDPKSETTIVFSGPFQYDQPHRITMRAMAMVLDGLLRESLREDLGGTYGVSVQASSSPIPVPSYSVRVAFGSSPERADELAGMVFRKIEQLKQNGPTANDVSSIREIFMRELEANSRQNRFYLGEIVSRLQTGEDLAGIETLGQAYAANVNAAAIQEAARTYFNIGNYVKVTLVPEQRDAPSGGGSAPARLAR
jgi:zinc protease